MNVRVRGHGQLAQLTGGREIELDLPAPATVGAAAARLGVPPGARFLALLNGRQASPSDSLSEGDAVLFLPAMAGG